MPPSGGPALAPGDTKLEPEPKPLPTAASQDPAGIVRFYVTADGKLAPAVASVSAGKSCTVAVNNGSPKDLPIEVTGAGADAKGTAVGNAKSAVAFTPSAGEYKIKVGDGTATITAK